MRILILGGTGFIGRHVVNELSRAGHELAIIHRGRTGGQLPKTVINFQVQGSSLVDRSGLAGIKSKIRQYAPEIIIDMIAQTEADTREVVAAFAGIASRLILISSQDVYLAYGKLRGLEAGPPEPAPLTEASRLRNKLYPYRSTLPRGDEDPEKWVDDYDKILAERAAISNPELPATILRLPRVYGPGDGQHRLYRYVRRMADQRPVILVDRSLAQWRWTRGYVEDVAHAISLAASNELASRQVYNLGEADTMTEGEWIRLIGKVLGWKGQMVEAMPSQLPDHLKFPYDTAHSLLVDTTKIRQELGFEETVSKEESIWRTADWELANEPGSVEALQEEYKAEDRAWDVINR